MVNPAKVANLTARGVARSQRQKDKQGPLDVWTNTIDGVEQNREEFMADPLGKMREDWDSSVAQVKAMHPSEWHSTSYDATQDAFIANSEAVGDAAYKIAEADGAMATVGAVFGTLTALEQALSVPFSMIPFPAFPAIRVTDQDVGLPHAHMHPPNLTPPNPVPVPMPSTGPVIPIPFISGAATVLINKMPAGRCGDMGMGIWCGGYFPMYEIFLGSSSVWLEGARAARIGVDITKHCIFSTPKPNDPPVGPMIGTTVSCSPNVMIGGFPMPSLTAMAMGAAFKAMFKGLGKLKGMMKAADDVVEEAGEAAGKVRNISKKAVAEAMDQETFARSLVNFSDLPTGAKRIVRGLTSKMDEGGSRIRAGSGVRANDLRMASKYMNRELGVAVDKHGRLVVVSGKGRSVNFKRTDKVLVHTHPVSVTKASHIEGSMRSADQLESMRKAGHRPKLSDVEAKRVEKTQHTEAVVDWGGEVTHFDDTGVVSNPSSSPINDHGFITDY